MFDSLIQSNLEFINKLKISKFLRYFLFCFFVIYVLIFLAGSVYYSLDTKKGNIVPINTKSGSVLFSSTGSSQEQPISSGGFFQSVDFKKSILKSIDFLSKNYKDIFYAVFLLSIALIVIEPPENHREFIKRLYGQVLEQLKSERYEKLTKNIFAITNKEGTWIKFLIRDVTERIHFEIYVMDFSQEIDNRDTYVKRVDKQSGVYFQYALHIENLGKKQIHPIKDNLSPFFQTYNVLPNVWTMKSIISNINEGEREKNLSISYNLLSNLYKEKLGFANEDDFYEADKVRKMLFRIFNEKKNGQYKGESHYTSLKDLSKADVKIIANTFLEEMNYFFSKKDFYKTLKDISDMIS